jgi:hypothetical protein
MRINKVQGSRFSGSTVVNQGFQAHGSTVQWLKNNGFRAFLLQPLNREPLKREPLNLQFLLQPLNLNSF